MLYSVEKRKDGNKKRRAGKKTKKKHYKFFGIATPIRTGAILSQDFSDDHKCSKPKHKEKLPADCRQAGPGEDAPAGHQGLPQHRTARLVQPGQSHCFFPVLLPYDGGADDGQGGGQPGGGQLEDHVGDGGG